MRKKRYDDKGINEEIYYDSLSDLSSKLNECKNVYGINGTAALSWYRSIYRLNVIKLGRLEYQVREFPLDDYKDYIKTNETVLSIHIPSCGPLKEEEVIESFKKAYDFYGFKGKNMVLFCQTWLLFPILYYDICTEQSNMGKFYRLFDVVKMGYYEGIQNRWRIFSTDIREDTPLDNYTQNTSLQKKLAKYFRSGNQLGYGAGVIVFDGERIINK